VRVAAAVGAGPHAGEVGAGARLREPLAPDLLRAENPAQVAPLLLLRPVRDDRRPGHAETDDAEVRGSLGDRRLLEEDRVVAERRAGAAVLLRPGQPRVPGVVELPAPRPREPDVLSPAQSRRDVRAQPRPHLGAEAGFV